MENDNGQHWRPGKAVHSGSNPSSYPSYPGWTTVARWLTYCAPPPPIGTMQGARVGAGEIVHPMKTEGIRAGEIIGYRSWKLYYLPALMLMDDVSRADPGKIALRSYFLHYVWVPGVNTAKEGDIESGYGFFAYKSRKDFDGAFFSSHGSFEIDVTGEVEMWGDVVEHKLGYRSQYAEVRSIDRVIYLEGNKRNYYSLKMVTLHDGKLIDEIRNYYGVQPQR